MRMDQVVVICIDPAGQLPRREKLGMTHNGEAGTEHEVVASLYMFALGQNR